MSNTRIYKVPFANVYPHYLAKAEKKGRLKDEVDKIICWLTGYTEVELQQVIENKVSFEDFYNNCPDFHYNASKITGVVCGIRVEDIEDPLMQRLRYLDKLIDELAKGKSLDKILRT